MKITSVIFLFVALALVASGVFLMNYARKSAPNDAAIDGYEYGNDGANVLEVSLSENDITKYSMTLTDCDIEIFGNTTSSYATLRNFKPNQYSSSISGKSYTVTDDISIKDYISFDGTGVKFAGVWQSLLSEYYSFRYKNTDRKSVTLYINTEKDLNQISLKLNNCTLRLSDISGECDVSVSASNSLVELNSIDSSLVVLNSVESEFSVMNITADTFNLTVNGGTFGCEGVSAKSATVNSEEIDLTLKNFNSRTLIANVKNGSFKYNTMFDITSFARSIKIKEGEIFLNDVSVGSSSTTDKHDEYVGAIAIEGENANVDITFGTAILLPEVTEEEGGETEAPETEEPEPPDEP